MFLFVEECEICDQIIDFILQKTVYTVNFYFVCYMYVCMCIENTKVLLKVTVSHPKLSKMRKLG